MEKEIKNTIYLSIELILAAAVITMFGMFIHMRNEVASIRSEATISKNLLKEASMYSAYDDTWMTGMQVIRAITESAYNDDLEVCIKGVSDDDECAALYGIGTDPVFSRNVYLAHPELYEIKQDDTGEITPTQLVQYYADTVEKASKLKYHAILVYNSEDITTSTGAIPSGTARVTGIQITFDASH